ncbi:hypothetical protein SDRG_16454 [Saprolegnia diclina VS20]|uniref:Dynamin N-terminal domain-containing protein n=1 Tax=Saprolegnia diclina (strain VS20) TaxID=1156394 RepID=T0R0Z6_SAPDV|nr:hypothetical protein SDRG_16454 [Saprolegnia diclina VS20]EQC25668.1 hypothetical protein SDRG_16454 [Saprolegnia diclina VS20]|eukprot:XP_008620887.1 hypothetical protein SDRG_16454 [Saprolegnia diclina VS20]
MASAMSEDMKIAGELNRMVQKEVETMFDRMEGLRQASKFASFARVHTPMVLVLGNHSSGKSTFINHMLGQDVQKTGRAPTDCTFTVIAGGKRAERLDGYALSRNNKFGFQDIKGLFGADFVSQVELKMLEKCDLLDETGMMIIDSPGMIDPPGTSADRSDMDRGYDFKRVVRWFAERADIVLLMFDPDKPGTTFETLDVLTSSLQHVNSKVRLILNKVDDFKSVHDFARAYGALCWNLSKVIPRKDMPFIYSMYVPTSHIPMEDMSTGNVDEDILRRLLVTEFDGTRGEIIREVQRAPDLATENLLTIFKGVCAQLKMHVTLIEACQKEYLWTEKVHYGITAGLVASGVGLGLLYVLRTWGTSASDVVVVAASDDAPPSWKLEWAKQVAFSKRVFRWGSLVKILVSSGFAAAFSHKIGKRALEEKQKGILQWLPRVFETEYAPVLCKNDRLHDETRAIYASILPTLELALTARPLTAFAPFTTTDKSYLDEVLATHVPRLDRSVRDRAGDDYAYLRFKHFEKPSLQSQ